MKDLKIYLRYDDFHFKRILEAKLGIESVDIKKDEMIEDYVKLILELSSLNNKLDIYDVEGEATGEISFTLKPYSDSVSATDFLKNVKAFQVFLKEKND